VRPEASASKNAVRAAAASGGSVSGLGNESVLGVPAASGVALWSKAKRFAEGVVELRPLEVCDR